MDQLMMRSAAIDASPVGRLSYGLYVRDHEPGRLADELRAWSLVLPARAAFTHLTAAQLRGWWLPQPVPHPVFAALRQGDPCPHRTGLLVSRHPLRTPSELCLTSG
jgi:hypothetical protein